MTLEAKTSRVETVENLYKMFDTARNLRQKVWVQTQTEVSIVAGSKIKDIALPSLRDDEINETYNHPFSSLFKFMNRDTIEFEKRLTIDEPDSSKAVNIKR